MNAHQLLLVLAERAKKADDVLDLMSKETPVDFTHYTIVETQRATYWEIARTVEALFRLDPGEAERTFATRRSDQFQLCLDHKLLLTKHGQPADGLACVPTSRLKQDCAMCNGTWKVNQDLSHA